MMEDINAIYGKSSAGNIKIIVDDILSRYLRKEYFDLKLRLLDENSQIFSDKNAQQNEYSIIIQASLLSTLSQKEIEFKLVASLFDIDTKEIINDGDSEVFEVLDYKTTQEDFFQ